MNSKHVTGNTLFSGLGAEVDLFMYSSYRCHLIASGSGIQLWAQDAVCMEAHMFASCLCVFLLDCSFLPSPKNISWIDDLKLLLGNVGVWGSLWRTLVLFRVYSCPVHTWKNICSGGQSFIVNPQLRIEIPPVESKYTWYHNPYRTRNSLKRHTAHFHITFCYFKEQHIFPVDLNVFKLTLNSYICTAWSYLNII